MDAVEQISQSIQGEERDDGTFMVEIQGKHGIIEMVFPSKPPTEDERIELYRKLADSVLRSHKKETTSTG
ncbi:hypothetical protein [Paenibacillus sp. FSL R7-0333]|uniref:hypothetical protein n=1 Tax=Paenibacillus sp. FSL R7-0333 TaxID=1926587 RepID=UPI00096EBCCA|nr:hypothetical protein BK146_17015 [Paenibacillus sp. FSL R7-0333]